MPHRSVPTRRLLPQIGRPLVAVGVAGSALLSVGQASAQQAYFSIEGEITNTLGQHDIYFDLPTGATSSDELFFRTYNNAGLTNAAGDATQASDIDPVLDLFSFDAGLSASNDDGVSGPNSGLDSLLSWPGIADSGGTLPATGLPAADDYRLTFRDFGDNSTGWWGVDAVGPADKLILTQMIPDAANPGGVSVIRSLKFGTASLDPTPATFDYIGLSDLVITGDLVLNSRALLQHDQGEISVGGTLDININSDYNLTGGTLDLDGDLDIDFGTMTVSSAATLDRAAGTSINLNNGGTLVHNPGTVFSGTDLNIAGGGDASFFGFFGLATSGDGTISVDGTGSSFIIDSAFNTFWGQNGNTATLNVTNNATASIDFAGGIDFARSTDADSAGIITVNAGGDLTFANTKLTLAEDNSTATATVTVTGTDSTITHTGDKELIVGGTSTGSATINVNDNAVYTTGTGLTTIAATGSVDVTTGGTFNANGDLQINGGSLITDATGVVDLDGSVTIDGGALEVQVPGSFALLAANKTLTATNLAQVTTNGRWDIDTGHQVLIAGNADLDHNDSMFVGSMLGSGTLSINGTGSTADIAGNLALTISGGTGIVNVQNNAELTVHGQLGVSRDSTNATTAGTLNINTGGDLIANGLILIGNLDGNKGTGTINLDGTGSTLTQTGASTLTLGNVDTPGNGGVHTINITNSGVFNTATGTTTIRKTGTLNVSSFGSFKANGDVNLVGGTININTGGGFDLAAGKTVTASAGGQFNFNTGAGGYTVFKGTTLNINDDADLLIEAGLFVGFGTNGTLNIDGAGSTLTINNNLNSQFVGRIGPNGSTGVLTLRNGALGTLADEDLWIANFGGGSGTVNVESGASLNLGIIEMSTNDEGTSVINVTGSGSTLTQSGASALTVGSAGTSSATINITDSGVFDTGTGTTTINATGSVDVTTGGSFNADGDLIINGGALTVDAASNFDPNGNITVDGGTLNVAKITPDFFLASGKTLKAQNGGQVTTGGSTWYLSPGQSVEILSGADLEHNRQFTIGDSFGNGSLNVSGSGSTFTLNGLFDIAQSDSTGTATVQDNAVATINGQIRFATSANAAGAVATLNIQTGGDLTANTILIGHEDGDQGTGTLNLDGTGSTLTQTGGSSLTVGNANTAGNVAAHTINVTNSGVFNTGTGTTTIRKTGTLNINVDGSGIDGAEFNANGNVNVVGGALNVFVDARDFGLASGKKLTASQGAQVFFGDDFEINPGRTFEFNSGADLTVEDYLDIEAGTLIVDGVGTSVTTNTTDDVNTDWADTGAVVTIRNGGTYTIQQPAELDLADSIGATLATVRVESGGQMNLHELNLAPRSGGSASLTVTGTGSGVTQAGAALLNIGSDEAGATGTGLLVVEDSGVFTTGTGAVTVNPTGTIKLGNGTFDANGALAFSGGTLHAVITTGLEPALQADAGVTINPDATLEIELDPGLAVAESDSFALIESTSPIASTFANVEGFIIGGGLYFEQSVLNLGGTSTLIVTATMTLPGDTDYDGDVDDADLGTAFANYTGPLASGTGTKAWEDGDTDGDGDVDDADLGTSFSNYTGPLANASVPEPASLALLALGGLASLSRRRRAC